MINEINNITLLRFNYPYYTKSQRDPIINEYIEQLHLLQGRSFSRIYLKFPRKRGSRIYVENYDLYDERLARIDKIKYNKIVGTIFPQNIITAIALNSRGWNDRDVEYYFGITKAEVPKFLGDLLEKKLDSLEDNIYTHLFPLHEDFENRGPIHGDSSVVINLTKRKLKEVI